MIPIGTHVTSGELAGEVVGYGFRQSESENLEWLLIVQLDKGFYGPSTNVWVSVMLWHPESIKEGQ